MGFLDRFRAVRDVATAETGLSFALDQDSIPAQVFGLPSYEDPIAPVPRLSKREASQCAAVKRGRDMICGTIGSLPLNYLDESFHKHPNDLLNQPEAAIPRSVTMALTVEDLIYEAHAWWRITEKDEDDFPSKVVRLDPRSITVKEDLKVYVKPSGEVQGSASEWVPDNQLIHFYSPNDALLVAGARSIRTLLRLDAAASRMADVPLPSGVFTPREDAVEDDILQGDEVDEFLDGWEAKRAQRATAYVSGALDFTPLQWDPSQLQMVEAREGAVKDVARLMGISAEDMEVSTTSRTYLNSQQKQQELVNYTLAPYLTAIQDRLSMQDVSAVGFTARFDLGGLVRADEKTRVDTHQEAVAMGLYSLDYAQKREGLPPNAAPPMPVQVAGSGSGLRSMPTGKDVPVARTHQQAAGETFAADDGHFGFEADPETALAFEVDVAKREIFGLAVPYGRPTTKNGKRYQFSQGSLTYAGASRVKMLDSHDRSKAVGKAIELTDAPEGMWARFKVARGAEGDRVLQLADDGVYDGLSIGLGASARFRLDAQGVHHAVSAPLAEISILPFPSFDDARVSSVTASADEGITTMPCATCGLTHAEGVTACGVAPAAASGPVTLSADSITALATAFAAALPQPKAGPKPVPAVPGSALQITEESIYRFDTGVAGAYDFSSDLLAAGRDRNPEARERLDKFMDLQFAVATTDVNEANPVVYRPEMYVDQLDYTAPIFNTIRKGSLDSITPFSYAAYSSSSGLVTDHVEGTEPTLGTFVLTGDTVTPTALSGKVEINREVWDQVGNPAISGLLWREIQRAYAEGLETATVTYLDSLSPTQITITAGAEDDVLEGELTAALASLNYIRGGYRMRDFFLQIDLFKKLIAAVDGNGRKLFPVIGPSNAGGTVAPFYASVDIGGLLGRPAWALAATGAVAASSYLLNREDVSAWSTPPRKLEFDYQVKSLFVGVWGYKAFKATRVGGIREVIYDPVA